jgi:serine/threonine protein phosphatase PrpC
MIEAFGLSDVGLVRKTNEDCLLCSEELGLFVVADGMGGHSAGEVASQLAVEALEGFVRRTRGDCEFSWPYGIDPTMSLDGNRLRTAIHLANRRVFRAAESRDDFSGMGTTVVSALFTESRFIVGHVGDSRLYLLCQGSFQALTRDDSWIATVLANDPNLDPEVLARHPMRHVLTNVLGARDEVDVHLAEYPIDGEGLVLLTSDGLHGAVGQDVIERLMLGGGDLEAMAGKLVRAALDQGGRDNITVLIVRYRAEP